MIAVEGWLFIVVIWVGCLWIGRKTWRPLADTTAAFIILVMGFSSPLPLTYVLIAPSTVLSGWLGLPLFVGWLFWFRRRQRTRLEYLRGLRHQLLGH